MKIKSGILLLTLIALEAFFISGCSGDKDPNAKVDAPGYYNGPMKPRGVNAAPAGGNTATPGGAASTQ